MKPLFYTIFLLLSIPLVANGQSSSDSIPPQNEIKMDSLLIDISENVARLAYQDYAMEPERGRYKMYQTENLYNLLKLDTATGRIEQVQWSLKDSEEMTVTINYSYLSYTGKIGTFELYPTKNMYQFILLDTTDGRTWHVQWGTESKKRWIKRIY